MEVKDIWLSRLDMAAIRVGLRALIKKENLSSDKELLERLIEIDEGCLAYFK